MPLKLTTEYSVFSSIFEDKSYLFLISSITILGNITKLPERTAILMFSFFLKTSYILTTLTLSIESSKPTFVNDSFFI